MFSLCLRSSEYPSFRALSFSFPENKKLKSQLPRASNSNSLTRSVSITSTSDDLLSPLSFESLPHSSLSMPARLPSQVNLPPAITTLPESQNLGSRSPFVSQPFAERLTTGLIPLESVTVCVCVCFLSVCVCLCVSYVCVFECLSVCVCRCVCLCVRVC